MPNPPSWIGPASGLIGTALGAIATNKQNQKSRDFSREQYQTQKNDNLAFWNQQNDYNNPANQMKRLQAAGLNPNMVYGQSSGGASGQASPIKTPDLQSAQFRVPDFGGIGQAGQGVVDNYWDTKIKQAQVDNLRVDNTVKLEEAILKRSKSSTNKFDLGLSKDLRQNSLDYARSTLRKLNQDTDLAGNEDERRTAQTGQNIKESAEKIFSMREQRAKTREDLKNVRQTRANLIRSGELQRMDIKLRKNNIMPSDPAYLRGLQRLIDNWDEAKKATSDWWFKN